MGWHTPQEGYLENPYKDGINRPHAWCRYCGKHTPLFGIRKIKIILGKKRQKSLIRTITGKLVRYN